MCVWFSPSSFNSRLYVFIFSAGRRVRGDAGETTAGGRGGEGGGGGGGQRGGARDPDAEEPAALLPLPNQAGAGAAGTGLLSLW